MKWYSYLLCIVLLMCSTPAFALDGATHLSCNPPTERENGKPFTKEEVSFYLFYVTKPDNVIVELRDEDCELDLILAYGDYSHQAIVCDKDLNCSVKSAVRKFTVKNPPKKPSYPSARII